MSDFRPLWDWINERHAIYLRKTILEGKVPTHNPLNAGPRPTYSLSKLTHDPILQKYRFCNVFRELDRVTIWIRQNIREPYCCHEHLWFMLAVARTLNWPDTLQELINEDAWPLNPKFKPSMMTKVLDRRKARGDKVYSAAYMIRAESDKRQASFDWTKQRYIAEIVLGKLWKDRKHWHFGRGLDNKLTGICLSGCWEDLQTYRGWGPFMAFQTVLEWRHTRLLKNATDIPYWAAIGPGSMRGLNRLHGREVTTRITQEAALLEMQQLLELSRTKLGKHVPSLELEDIQNSLCETDKYLRVKTSDGKERPKALYIPGRGY